MAKKKENFPTQPSFIGKSIYLRVTTPEDKANTFYWSLQSEPQKFCCHPVYFYSPSEIAELYKKKERDPYLQDFAIVTKDKNQLVGQISIFNQ